MEAKRELWKKAILKHWQRGHYRKALLLMAANVGDKGNVESLIDSFCANADPAENWREVE